MKNLNMNELTAALIERGYNASFDMSGGNCGTIYFNFTDEKGSVGISVGPSNFTTGEANSAELCWARNEIVKGEFDLIEESLTYYDPEKHGDFTVQNIVEAILDQITE